MSGPVCARTDKNLFQKRLSINKILERDEIYQLTIKTNTQQTEDIKPGMRKLFQRVKSKIMRGNYILNIVVNL